MNMNAFLKNYLVYAVVISVGVFAALFFVVLPMHQRIRAEGDEIQKILAKTENSERKVARLPEFQAQHEAIRGNEARIRTMLTEDRTVEFIREIERLAGQADGTVAIAQGSTQDSAKKKVAPAKDAEDGASASASAKAEPKTIGESLPWEKSLRLNIRFSGTYPESVDFLHKMETMPYRIDVIALDIRPTPDDRRREEVLIGDLLAVPSTEDGKAPAPEPAPAPSEFSVDASFEVVVYLE